jgi:hypothetical protein
MSLGHSLIMTAFWFAVWCGLTEPWKLRGHRLAFNLAAGFAFTAAMISGLLDPFFP